MDNPFSADNSNPFLTPYQAPGASPSSPGIKPFTAVDLAPPAGLNGNRHSAPPPVAGPTPFAGAPGPSASPFASNEFDNAFLGREAPTSPTQAAHAAPVPASSLAASLSPSPAHAAPVVNPFTGKPSPTPPAPADFTPVPERPKPAPVVSPTVIMTSPLAPMAPAMPTAPMAERPSVPKPIAQAQAPAPKPALMTTDFAEPTREARGEFLLTTSPNAEGRKIASYLGVVSVEIVIPKDVLFRNPAPYGELHRIKAAEDQLQSVKKKAFEELTERAKAMGADGIVAATLQFSQFDAVVFLCAAVGTAVRMD